jgi:hypothetical protein
VVAEGFEVGQTPDIVGGIARATAQKHVGDSLKFSENWYGMALPQHAAAKAIST